MFSDRYHHRKVHEGHGDIIREETLAYINVSGKSERATFCAMRHH